MILGVAVEYDLSDFKVRTSRSQSCRIAS
jgi:hypothetical protein